MWPEELNQRFSQPVERAAGRLSTLYEAKEGARTVAVKVLHRHVHENPSVRRRLRREVATTRRLSHPAVLRIDDLIATDETVALVMEFVPGRSVRERVQEDGPMSWEACRPLLAMLLEALGEAHEKGIWHRDLNAEHVLLVDGEDQRGVGAGEGETPPVRGANGRREVRAGGEQGLKIVGFGMARVDELVALTMHTRVLGSLDAMAPERVLGMDYDARADLYSVGAVAYELLLGHPPADGTMADAFRLATAGGVAEHGAMAELPAVAQTFLERALTADASSRFATAEQMIRALQGDYDEALWRSWSERNVSRCPECDALEIEGLNRCLECGYEFKRLVQSPAGGAMGVRVITPKMDYKPELWFEKNLEPDEITGDHVRKLMDFLEQYEDVAPFADGRWEYRHAPYFLLTDLGARDGVRIQELLSKQGVPAELASDWRSTAADTKENANLIQGGMSTAVGLLMLGLFVALSAMLGLGWGWIGLGLVLFFVPRVLMHRLFLPATMRTAASDQTEGFKGTSIMIPTRRLRHAVPGLEADLVPSDTGEILKGLKIRSVQREVNELLALSVSLAGSQGAARVLSLNVGILAAGQVLEDRLRRLRELDPATLLTEADRTRTRMEAAEGEGDVESAQELYDEEQALMGRLEDEDRLRAEVTALQGRLLAVRAALLDLRGQRADELMLQEEQVRLEGLQLLLEAEDPYALDLDAELEQMAQELAT